MGRAFSVGDNISTDALAPGKYLRATPEEMASHCLETEVPGFAAAVKPGDLLFTGFNFGMGSSREQAAGSLKLLGIEAVIARSVARTFYRNAINFGLPVLIWDHAAAVAHGDEVALDLTRGFLRNITRSADHEISPLPERLQAIIRDGGLVPHLKKKIASGELQSTVNRS